MSKRSQKKIAQSPPATPTVTSSQTAWSPRQFFSRYWQPVVFVLFAVFLRVWNFHNSLYFIYDQGRDALVLEKMAHGHPVLVGPTSGLAGFFLGPLWYYIGLPGFLLAGGNPYGICLWYIAISCLALPLFWILAHRLFKEKIWALLCAAFLVILPGSIQASIFIWNPLLSVPLMTGVLLSFWQSRKSRLWLAIGFFLLALTLQSEFAYAVFFLPIFFLLIPWLRQKLDWRDFGTAIVAGGVTALPQLLFEVRNHFIMTTSLLHSIGDSTQSVSWQILWATRPAQLMDVTRTLLLGGGYSLWMFSALLILLVFLAILALVQKQWLLKLNSSQDASNLFLWKLVFLFALIPYPFFMLWRGNHGYFFPYYLTAHFVFLVPLIILGIHEVVHLGQQLKERNQVWFAPMLTWIAAVMCIVVFAVASWQNWNNVVFQPQNNAGLAKMLSSVEQIYTWHQEDSPDPTQPWVVKTYTANVYTEQYDYLLGWYGRAHHLNAPRTVLTGQEKIWYVLIESRAQALPIFFDPWYATATKDGRKTRTEQIGVLTLETWRK